MCHCLCASSDQEYVEGYRVQIVSAASTARCIARLGVNHTILNDVAFDNKVSWLTALLKKVAVGDAACIEDCHWFFTSVGQPDNGRAWNRSS